MLILITAVVILLLYMLFISAQRYPFGTLLVITLFIGMTIICAYFGAAVQSTYGGQKEWQQEREFFLRIFIQKLESSGDLKTAAAAMQADDVKKQTLECIRKIVNKFHPRILWNVSIGVVFLLGAASSLGFKTITQKKYYPYLLLLFVLLGAAFLNTGIYYHQYASGTDRQLKRFLYLQQEYVMKDLSEIKTGLSVPEIVKITLKEAERINGHGYGQRLPELLRSPQTGSVPDKDR